MGATVWTIGHSSHEAGAFLALLANQGITAVADVRSQPYSRHAPDFGKEALQAALRSAGVAYVFLGQELGGRSDDEAVLTDGRVDFGKLAQTARFQAGLERVRAGAEAHRIALLCAEHDPLHCHRSILITRHVHAGGLDIQHIHADGAVEGHAAFERRLLEEHGLGGEDLFTPYDARLDRAYHQQAQRVAWQPPEQAAPE